MIVYLDASAWAKTFNTAEPYRDELLDYVDARTLDQDLLVSNEILVLETLNLATQRDIPLDLVQRANRKLTLVENRQQRNKNLFHDAGIRILPPDPYGNRRQLKALDKLHLETALQVGADELLVYDRRFAGHARSLGLTVVSPGQQPTPPTGVSEIAGP